MTCLNLGPQRRDRLARWRTQTGRHDRRHDCVLIDPVVAVAGQRWRRQCGAQVACSGTAPPTNKEPSCPGPAMQQRAHPSSGSSHAAPGDPGRQASSLLKRGVEAVLQQAPRLAGGHVCHPQLQRLTRGVLIPAGAAKWSKQASIFRIKAYHNRAAFGGQQWHAWAGPLKATQMHKCHGGAHLRSVKAIVLLSGLHVT